MKRSACPYDPNHPGNRYQELLRQLVLVRQGNEQVIAALEAIRGDLAELKEMCRLLEAKLGELRRKKG